MIDHYREGFQAGRSFAKSAGVVELRRLRRLARTVSDFEFDIWTGWPASGIAYNLFFFIFPKRPTSESRKFWRELSLTKKIENRFFAFGFIQGAGVK